MSLTNGRLYDLAAEKLGIGNYDDVADERVPWEYRRNQIGMLSRGMKARRLHADDVEFTIGWCAQRRLLVPHVNTLLRHVDEALRWQRSQSKGDDLEAQIAEAIGTERAWDDTSLWIGKLARAKGPGRQNVLDEWREYRRGR
jgi:hypothetical protein